MSDFDSTPKLRLRFSLLNLLLLTAIVALSLSLWQAHQKLRPLEERILKLRREAGIVDAPDPKKLYVRKLNGENRWRAYVPPGEVGKACVMVRFSNQPKMAHAGQVELPQGETSFAVSLENNVFHVWKITEERRRNMRGVDLSETDYGPLSYVSADQLSDLSLGVSGDGAIAIKLIEASAQNEKEETLTLTVEVHLD